MSKGIAENPLSFYARVAGASILLVIVIGILANLFVLDELIVPGDGVATANNITANELLYRFGNFSFIIANLLDLVAAWALYVLFKGVNKNVALLATFFRVVYLAIYSTALFNALSILDLLSDEVRSESMERNQIGFEVTAYIDSIYNALTIATIFFAIHALLLGYLIFKSGFMPKVLGILLMLAGLVFFIDNIAWILLSNYYDLMGIFPFIVFLIGIIAEVSFAIWLLVRGKKIDDRIAGA